MTAPKINAPGLTWRKLKFGYECRWRARPDLITKGWIPRNVRLFQPTPDRPAPGEPETIWIMDRANALQDEMLVWGRGGIEPEAIYHGTWASLIGCYKSDKDSPYGKKRYGTRKHYDTLCRRIVRDCGNANIEDTDARALLRLHDMWSGDGEKIAMGHSVMGMVRTLISFGSTLLKCPHCRALRSDLHEMRFKGAKPRNERLTAEMVEAIRAMAPSMGRRSIALAQAFQFDLMLRQKDVIGEWVPISEPGVSDVIDRNEKWLRGLRWEEIDNNLILRHTTSKRQKDIDPDLNLAPMVLEELRFMAGIPPGASLRRERLPATGPIVIQETNGLPWNADEFRRYWRTVAKAAGVPNNVRNMDSRAGAISEATDAGAELEHVRHAATHSDIAMTQRYSRGSQDKVAKVMKLRAAFRKARQ
jgi:hypothetical protein